MLEGYVDNSPDPFFVLNDLGQIRHVNAAGQSLFQIATDAELGTDITEIRRLNPGISEIADVFKDLIEDGMPARRIIRRDEPNQNRQPLLISATPFDAPDGEALTAIQIQDLSDTMPQFPEAQLADSLVRLNEDFESFAYSVAHDLRAPLRFIDKFAYLLLVEHGADLSPIGLQYAEQIREGARQMAQLIEDLLAFSRATGQDLNCETVDLDTLVRDCILNIETDIEGRSLEFDVGDLGTCEADPRLLKQALLNLLWNAEKFTRPRYPARIDISRMDSDRDVVICVADNGVGFDAESADRIFQVFQRFHQPEDFEGSGVGLAIVKRIIERHGGSVWAEGAMDKGARFYFRLPPTTHVEES